MANAIYNAGRSRLGAYNWENFDSTFINVRLIQNTYTFDATHALGSITAHEASGPGYTTITQILSVHRSVTENDVSNFATFDVIPFSGTEPARWTGIDCGTDLRILLHWFDTGAPLCYIDTGTNIPINTYGGMVTISFPNGLLKLSM